jgi:hypothetical protein
MQVGPVGNRIAGVDPNPEVDGAIRRLIAIVDRDLLLDLRSTVHGSIDALEGHEQRVPAGLNDLSAVLCDRGVN